MSSFSAWLGVYGVKILLAIAIFFIGKKLARWLSKIIIASLKKTGMDETLESFLSSVLYGLFITIVVIAALAQLGIETTSFVALLGAVGLAIGLAFKDTLSNISAGVMIIVFKPIKIGEYVEAGGTGGTITQINIFHTIMNTPDNKVIIIGNANIIGNNITNYSRQETRRVDFVFGIGYEDDLKLAKEILTQIVNEDSRVLQEEGKEPFVAVGELADSSVNFVVRAWTKKEDYWSVKFETIEKVKLTFDEKGISIPFPQMDIHYPKHSLS